MSRKTRRKQMKRSIYKTVIAAVVLFAFAGCAFADGGAVVSVEPTSSTISTGGTATVDVDISGVSDLYAYQFDILFGALAVSATSETEGGFLATGGTTFFIPGTIDNIGGGISSTANTLIGAISGVDGSGTLIVLEFTGFAPGTASIDLENVILLDSNFNPIDFTTQDATLTVQGGVTPAPEPSAWVLFGMGLIGVIGLAHRKVSAT
jgi:adhesin HecA-like repeat protein